MSCPKCQRHRLVEVQVRLADTTLTMRSCSACDNRWWDRDGNPVALAEVLSLTAAHR